MIELTNTEVEGWEAAIRGMRNPLESWEQSDSKYIDWYDDLVTPNIDPKDHDLMMRLCKAGTDHRKFMRMIVCYVDIKAPLYWWKEFDTYRAGVEKNSCSTMHCIHKKEFTLDDFSHEHLRAAAVNHLMKTIELLNIERDAFNGADNPSCKGDKQCWYSMIQLLPESYNQKRTCMISYEALANMYHARKNHKLDEWHTFCRWIEGMPYSDLITGEVE